ncbi:MAG: hypothetical protein QW478_10055 [Candidatus Micrarchaeaceae archaeon]
MNDDIDHLKKENTELRSALLKTQNEINEYRQKINLLVETNNDLRDLIEAYQISIQSLSSHLEVISNQMKEILEKISEMKTGEWA